MRRRCALCLSSGRGAAAVPGVAAAVAAERAAGGVVATCLSATDAGVAEYGILAVWAFFFLVIIDSVLMGARLKKRLGEKFGESKVEKGYRWYAAMRALEMRPLRLPKPQVKRGDEVK